MRTGSTWNKLPPEYGNWETQYPRFIRWREAGIWEKLLDVFLDKPELEWLMMDTSGLLLSYHIGSCKTLRAPVYMG